MKTILIFRDRSVYHDDARNQEKKKWNLFGTWEPVMLFLTKKHDCHFSCSKTHKNRETRRRASGASFCLPVPRRPEGRRGRQAPSRGCARATKPAAKIVAKKNRRMQNSRPGEKQKRKKKQQKKGAKLRGCLPPRRSIQPKQNSQVHERIQHIRSEQRVEIVRTEVFGKTGPA